jgi:exonuclease VII large subunit
MRVHAGEHVVFDFHGALELARRLWALGTQLEAAQRARCQAQAIALAHWRGRYAQQFRESAQAETQSAAHLAEALRADARHLARRWSMAMDQEAKVRYAEHVSQVRAARSMLEQVTDHVLGDHTDYGPRPSCSSDPRPPAFTPTAQLPHYR